MVYTMTILYNSSRLPETIITSLESITSIIQYREIMAHSIYVDNVESSNRSQLDISEPIAMVIYYVTIINLDFSPVE